MMASDGCQDGAGERTRLGYVRIWVGGVRRLAHVVAWETANGKKVPDGFELDHACNNRWCRNPSHLRPVTHAENCQRRKSTKMTKESAAEVRKLAAEGVSVRALAERHCVTTQNIMRIVKGETWR